MYSWQFFTLGLVEHLSWPIVVLGLVCCFRKDIKKLLSRIKTLPGGTELEHEALKDVNENKINLDKLIEEKEKVNFENLVAKKEVNHDK